MITLAFTCRLDYNWFIDLLITCDTFRHIELITKELLYEWIY